MNDTTAGTSRARITVASSTVDTGVDASTMVQRVDALEEAGLIERRRNSEDRRSYQIALTAEGHECSGS